MTIDMTWEHREELIRRDEREEGRQEGREEGREEGRQEGRQEGREEGAREQQRLDQAIIDAKDDELKSKDAELEKYRLFIQKQGFDVNSI